MLDEKLNTPILDEPKKSTNKSIYLRLVIPFCFALIGFAAGIYGLVVLTKSSFFNFDPPPKPLVYPIPLELPNEWPSWCPSTVDPGKRVVLFWQTERAGCEMIPEGVTYVVWGFAQLTPDSTLIKGFQGNDDALKECIKSLRRRCIRSMVSIGGAANKANMSVVSQPKKLAQNVLELVQEFTFDGVDIDDEVVTMDGFKEDNLLEYTKEIYNSLKGTGKHYPLTACIIVGEVYPDCSTNKWMRCISKPILPYLDWIHVMAYNVAEDIKQAEAKYNAMIPQTFPDYLKLLPRPDMLSIGFCLGKACAYGPGPSDSLIDKWTKYSNSYGGMMIYSGNIDISHDFKHAKQVIKVLQSQE